MREAVNRSVTTVQCHRGVSLHGADLAEVFPEAEHLVVSMDSPEDLETQSCPELESPAAWLDHLAACSPLLLGKVQSLELDLSTGCQDYSAEDASSIANVLSRCVNELPLRTHVHANAATSHTKTSNWLFSPRCITVSE
jgi:hypothetical protein